MPPDGTFSEKPARRLFLYPPAGEGVGGRQGDARAEKAFAGGTAQVPLAPREKEKTAGRGPEGAFPAWGKGASPAAEGRHLSCPFRCAAYASAGLFATPFRPFGGKSGGRDKAEGNAYCDKEYMMPFFLPDFSAEDKKGISPAAAVRERACGKKRRAYRASTACLYYCEKFIDLSSLPELRETRRGKDGVRSLFSLL